MTTELNYNNNSVFLNITYAFTAFFYIFKVVFEDKYKVNQTMKLKQSLFPSIKGTISKHFMP